VLLHAIVVGAHDREQRLGHLGGEHAHAAPVGAHHGPAAQAAEDLAEARGATLNVREGDLSGLAKLQQAADVVFNRDHWLSSVSIEKPLCSSPVTRPLSPFTTRHSGLSIALIAHTPPPFFVISRTTPQPTSTVGNRHTCDILSQTTNT
jgi:hypothetical protein